MQNIPEPLTLLVWCQTYESEKWVITNFEIIWCNTIIQISDHLIIYS